VPDRRGSQRREAAMIFTAYLVVMICLFSAQAVGEDDWARRAVAVVGLAFMLGLAVFR
jgi:hypothetical protein